MAENQNNATLWEKFGAYSVSNPTYYDRFDIKRGLRNADGTGVLAGITSISNVHGYLTDDGMRVPCEGRLTLRGYDINDLVDNAAAEGRFGYEELTYLLWSGNLPTADEVAFLQGRLDFWRDLPQGFVASLIMNNPSKRVMNMLARSILLLYAADPDSDSTSPRHEIDTAVQLISRLPRLAVLSYLANEQAQGKPMHFNPPQEGLSTAETLLWMLRPGRDWTSEEAKMLDIMLMLHAEHGGGNNSTFTTRVLTSSGTDAYSAYAGGVCSLKGPRHGGANIKVADMHADLRATVPEWSHGEGAALVNEGAVADYLARVIRGEAYDGAGLIYGMGHAVYTMSDPRAIICKRYAREMASGTEFEAQFALIEAIERLAPEVFLREKGAKKNICANIDMYSGLVYRMMGIPEELYTPLFACARMAGWAAHRFEEISVGKRIIRPAYKSVHQRRAYVPMDERAAAIDWAEVRYTDDADEYAGNND